MTASPVLAKGQARVRPAVPDFIVIGAQKAGSSFVQDAIRSHPQVFMPKGESPFFEQHDAARRGDELAELLAGRRPGQIAGLKRPDYLARKGCAERIARVASDVRLVAVIRNPVDRAVAAYYHYMLHGFLPVLPADVGFRALLSGELPEDFPRSAEILEYGFYARHLAAYYARFELDQLHIVVYDRLRSDPTGTLNATYRFLGVDDTFVPRVRTSNQTVYSPARIRAIRAVARMRLPGAVGGLQRVDRIVGRRTAPPLSPPIVRALRELYADDVRTLRDQLGLEVGAWL